MGEASTAEAAPGARGGPSDDARAGWSTALIDRLRAWTKRHGTLAVALLWTAPGVALVAIAVLGYRLGWGWVGIAATTSPPHPPGTDYQRAKTLWDWLQLLVIPAALAAGGIWFNAQQGRRLRDADERQKERDVARDLDMQREECLVTYFDRLSDLLLKGELPPPADGAARTGGGAAVAHARTVTSLRRLDGTRKGHLVKFLFEAGLIAGDKSIIDLANADLTEVDLHGAHLQGANLQGAHLQGGDLHGAHLERAILHEARLEPADPTGVHRERTDLTEAHLDGADLTEAHLDEADLTKVHLQGANLARAHLGWAALARAHVEDAILRDAHLEYAILRDAHLERAHLTRACLEEASLTSAHLEGADLAGAHLEGADLAGAHLERASLLGAHLEGALLARAHLDGATYDSETRWPTPDFKADKTGAIRVDRQEGQVGRQ